ncbi:hypothetical protein ElyMa_005248500 [Elysia marginata]|uniref:Uncharacterized protein n=1 Tax=Elysia marginata TaxID=1093978 RepID=A0AAV4JZU2_9GAST|nr:hypothetical protein ElyMa_005248500 [Elysia marginata]
MAQQRQRKKKGKIGHTLQKSTSTTTLPVLEMEPQGKRRRDTEAKLERQGMSWSGVNVAAQNRVRWRGFAAEPVTGPGFCDVEFEN